MEYFRQAKVLLTSAVVVNSKKGVQPSRRESWISSRREDNSKISLDCSPTVHQMMDSQLCRAGGSGQNPPSRREGGCQPPPWRLTIRRELSIFLSPKMDEGNLAVLMPQGWHKEVMNHHGGRAGSCWITIMAAVFVRDALFRVPITYKRTVLHCIVWLTLLSKTVSP